MCNTKKLSFLAITFCFMIAVSACGDQAQEAAENANRDTVPVIETNPSQDSTSVQNDSVPSIR